MDTLAQFLPLIILLGVNAFIGTRAKKMAIKRGLRPVPAFWAGFFLSVGALFIIAMNPIQEK